MLKSVAEMETLLASARSGGGSDMIDRDTLLQLLDHAHATGYVVDAMEVYELKNGLETPRVDLGLYGGELVSETEGMSWEQSMAHIRGAVDFTLSATDKLDAPCGFQIWLAEAKAWRDTTA